LELAARELCRDGGNKRKQQVPKLRDNLDQLRAFVEVVETRQFYIQAILGIIRRLEAGLCIRHSAAPDHHQSRRSCLRIQQLAHFSDASQAQAMPFLSSKLRHTSQEIQAASPSQWLWLL
jgi:hypothetical protein